MAAFRHEHRTLDGLAGQCRRLFLVVQTVALLLGQTLRCLTPECHIGFGIDRILDENCCNQPDVVPVRSALTGFELQPLSVDDTPPFLDFRPHEGGEPLRRAIGRDTAHLKEAPPRLGHVEKTADLDV